MNRCSPSKRSISISSPRDTSPLRMARAAAHSWASMRLPVDTHHPLYSKNSSGPT